ncbi:fibronectin type III domain-containing protein (plasmid) [Apilactobacillus apisilvae]|uniref:Fibronectin type III domain-containing protein n=1 Tax=Apilactobacillus apisilvae TaxID=2923364 RepID=A0ABY4PIU8_9LACO|nr:fibronectin type III domain-containing protein [Apilactobacillus apisilvae]UQS85796.1 fibronectin type III domain-containing protein [Apilactobacillus apisilvae]
MATYDTPIFTNQSSRLIIAVAANSEQLTFTKIVYSSDDFSNKSDDDIANLTDLTNKEITANAQSFLENGITKVRGAGNNDNLDQGLNVRTFGLYAKGNNIPEMLVAVATSQTADYLDVHNNNSSNQLTYTFNLKISNTRNINFSNIHDVSVTQADLQSALAHIDLSNYETVEDANDAHKSLKEGIDDLDTQTSQGLTAIGQQLGQLIDINKFKDEFNTKLGKYDTSADVDEKLKNINLSPYMKTADANNTFALKSDVTNLGLAAKDGKLYYDNLPVITAQAPSGISVSLDRAKDGIQATINVADNGGLSNIYYQLFYKKSDDTVWQFIDHPARTSTLTVPMDGSTYDFKAKAGNSAGLSDESSVASILTIDGSIYGASWNQGVDSTLTRTDSAVGMVAGINGQRNDFDNAPIFGEMHRVNDDKGNVFVRIPKFYIKKTQVPGLSTWQVSKIKHDDSWYLPKCFWNFSSNQELPYVDVGAYLANLNGSVLESKVNTAPANSQTIGSFRNYARNNGAGYQQLDIHVWDVLQVLFIIEFATLDSQSVMYGNAENYNSGYTDGMKGSSAGDSNNIKYRGIESMYCNIFQFVDGIGINSGNIYVCDNANNYSDSQFSYPYRPVSYRLPESSNYMQSAGLDLSNPEVTLPTSTTSTQGYYNDYCYNDSGSNYAMNVGGYGSHSSHGLFCAGVHGAFSSSYSNVGSRLIKKPVL